MPTVRKQIKWPTKKRNGGTRQWKTKWITVHVKPGGGGSVKGEKPAPRG